MAIDVFGKFTIDTYDIVIIISSIISIEKASRVSLSKPGVWAPLFPLIFSYAVMKVSLLNMMSHTLSLGSWSSFICCFFCISSSRSRPISRFLLTLGLDC